MASHENQLDFLDPLGSMKSSNLSQSPLTKNSDISCTDQTNQSLHRQCSPCDVGNDNR
ncbi:hypothetical protein HanXRQr2_Chr09g0415771 [Helianthus annuus]|uniref:Uncharacterized protein n=1 Tax=Helianthus annuus TaxID=4232 RepID=A0A9K3IAU3_HELAN|nr:hypothetical protein HanXRQr2_Chr09g0415771 [Helianthus annuus]